MVHDVLGHGAALAAVLFTGGVYERVNRQMRVRVCPRLPLVGF